IYDSTAPEGTGEGVYIKAKARQLDNEEVAMQALKIMDGRIGKVRNRQFEKFSGDAPLRVYCATAQQAWGNLDDEDDQGNYIKDIRAEVMLEELKKLITKDSA